MKLLDANSVRLWCRRIRCDGETRDAIFLRTGTGAQQIIVFVDLKSSDEGCQESPWNIASMTNSFFDVWEGKRNTGVWTRLSISRELRLPYKASKGHEDGISDGFACSVFRWLLFM